MTRIIPRNKIKMSVIKRNKQQQHYSGDKVTSFIHNVAYNIHPSLSIDVNTLLPLKGVPAKVSSADLCEYIAQCAAAHTATHPDYGVLAGRAVMANLKKEAPATFSAAVTALSPALDDEYVNFVTQHAALLDSMVEHVRDFTFDIFAVATLKKSYLMRQPDTRVIVETPQYLYMRIATWMYMKTGDLNRIRAVYECLSLKQISHATPTMFNSAMKKNAQLASCFLVDMNDSIDSIFSTLKQCATISKNAGGVGLNISNIRGAGTPIAGTGGTSNGIVPMLHCFEKTALYCDQGGGKRKGSFAVFTEVHHPDLEDFLLMKKPDGEESRRCRSLFYGLWVSDLFFKRVEQDADWSLFDSTVCPELNTLYGKEYETAYRAAEQQGKATKVVKARHIFNMMLESMIETGTPYVLFKDAINRRNNQKAAGTITGSNLCCEIMEYKNKHETAVCTLASICLITCVTENNEFDFEKLRYLTNIVTENLNQTIDIGMYPVEEARRSHMKRRPIGIGVQSLGDVFNKLQLVYGSKEAIALDAKIHETIYLQAMKTSCELAKKHGYYKTFPESPLACGKFQFDLYDDDNTVLNFPEEWDDVRQDVMAHGVRNSLLVALMPTASSASICGNSESFEPRTSNCYVRRTLGGEFLVVNKYMFEDRAWTADMTNVLIRDRGSVKNMPGFTDHEKQVYRTVYECSMKSHIDHASARQRFVDQSQSMNLYFQEVSKSKLMKALFYGWRKGNLKTGCYYMRRGIKGSMMGVVDTAVNTKGAQAEEKKANCDDDDVCVMCSS